MIFRKYDTLKKKEGPNFSHPNFSKNYANTMLSMIKMNMIIYISFGLYTEKIIRQKRNFFRMRVEFTCISSETNEGCAEVVCIAQ